LAWSAVIIAVALLLVAGGIVVPIQLEKERRASKAAQEQRQLQHSRERILDMINVRRKTIEIVNQHERELARRHLLLVRPAAYGLIDWGPWRKEVTTFCNALVRTRLTANEVRFLKIAKAQIDRQSQCARDLLVVADSESVLSPIEFEAHCALLLERAGWNSRTTVATGDQGADILAEKNGILFVFQCKLYGTPVGNKAVQEAFAAQRHYRAQGSAVVTNNQFTRSASELAATTGVLLLHYSDLLGLSENGNFQ
jgi:restriction system protein